MRLIDADELNKKIEIDNFDSPMMNPVMTMTQVLKYIDEAPTIEPDRPHGEWIKFTLEGGFLSSHKCSNCGFNGNQLWHFCPNCDADMRGKTE